MSAVLSLAIQPNIYYTVEEAAQLLRVSAEEIRSLLQSGQMPGIKIGEHWRVLGGALLDLSPVTELLVGTGRE
jgi:excisionase family DNA binding protein